VSLLDLAAAIVVRTSDWPGLGRLYCEGYELGLSWTARQLASGPDVEALLLRVGDRGRSWVPGFSDFDLTILTERYDTSEMLRVLEAVWARYGRVKRRVPQLGEMEVMDVVEYRNFLRRGPMPTASLKHAEPLFVRPARPAVAFALGELARAAGAREYRLDALLRFIRFLGPAWLRVAAASSDLAARRAEHLRRNVVERLRRLGATVAARPADTLEERLTETFSDLTRACGAIRPGNEGVTVVDRPAAREVSGATPAVSRFVSDVLHHAGSVDVAVVLWTPYMSSGLLSLAFVVPDGVDARALRALVAAAGVVRRETETLWTTLFTTPFVRTHVPAPANPIVVSRAMWNAWRELSPFDGAAIAATGSVLCGELPDLGDMPSLASFRRAAEIHYAAMLPLRNSWRRFDGRALPRLYAELTNHVNGYATALTGGLRIRPEQLEFATIEDGYSAVNRALEALDGSLV
jgi:hypothetical protein